ncbi:MAG TPA: phosphoribosylamine--glycine ligase [Mycobacteriales bacterium]|nr:phosphoribosylamine--glycine ligase [Mycobacteriales bacterium]
MRVLVIGGGGREHALCWALSRDPDVEAISCAPGNPGIAQLAELRPLTDPVEVATAAAADLVVIGPEAPLVAGVADELRAAGFDVFGPSAAAAQLEGSKAFAKQVMAAAGVPTAAHHTCTTPDEVAAALDATGAPYVVKHDELAAGKGVVVTDDRDEAMRHAAGHTVVVEEFLDGPEVSLFCLTDGSAVVPLIPAQDFKRVGDGDVGPNTGGMGAYAPLPWAPPGLVDEVVAAVVQPTVEEMSRRGTPFTGLLYAGLALTSRGVKVVEFNARFGDPETQSVLSLLDTPLGGLLRAAATGELAAHPPLRWRDGAAVTVVLAASGYPAAPRTGDPVTGLDGLAHLDGVTVFHAGTAVADGRVVSSGGRVLAVTAVGAALAGARESAYAAIAQVHLDGGHYRHDIAQAAAEQAERREARA